MHNNLLQKALLETEQAKEALAEHVLQLEKDASKKKLEIAPADTSEEIASPNERIPSGGANKHELAKDKASRKGPNVDPINDNRNARGKPLKLFFPSEGFGRHGIWP